MYVIHLTVFTANRLTVPLSKQPCPLCSCVTVKLSEWATSESLVKVNKRTLILIAKVKLGSNTIAFTYSFKAG